ADPSTSPGHHTTSTTGPPALHLSRPPEPGRSSHSWRKWLVRAGIAVGVGGAGFLLVPWGITMLNTVVTEGAYVNGRVTFLAPRVPGQVMTVLVDDNYRVKRGDILVQLDKEPYQVQVAIKKAAVEVAQTELTVAQAQVRGQIAQARANRFKLEHAIE